MQILKENGKNYLSLTLWIITLIAIGFGIGFFTKAEISNWYSTLNRSPLTPVNYVFPIAWTILYALIGSCGYLIWQTSLPLLKPLYVMQLILNWCWTPLFFIYHLTDLALIVLLAMDITVMLIIYFAYRKLKSVAFMMSLYLLWIIFATYLNYYILTANGNTNLFLIGEGAQRI
jgi:tryptophan-rich sensory protein